MIRGFDGMTTFQIALLGVLSMIAAGILYIGGTLADLRKDVSEIWKRMKRLD
jgi:hypothetical protein